jgi:predicted transglutaminase-like cysteine proteinase
VPDALLTIRCNGAPQARPAFVRLHVRGVVRTWLWIGIIIVGLLCPGMPPLAWDSERMMLAAKKLSPRAMAGVQALQPVLAQALDMSEPNQLQAVNAFFNQRILFRDDTEVWGQVDYWASPLETLDKGAGDCEDYAIAKYFSLLAVGVPVSKLRLVYVRAQIGGPQGALVAHMVLAYYAAPGAEPTILDNLITELRPASRRPDLVPVFSFNSEGLWQGVGPQAAAGDPTARLSRWREVLAKAHAEGFQ